MDTVVAKEGCHTRFANLNRLIMTGGSVGALKQVGSDSQSGVGPWNLQRSGVDQAGR